MVNIIYGEMVSIHRKENSIGLTKKILVFLLVVGMSLCLIPAVKAYGYAYGEKTSTVDMYVGYFGNTYAYIGTVTEDEMKNNCECGEWVYSSIDRGGRTRHNVAYGATVESLLNYVGIDVNSIDEIYFLGTDDDYYAGFSNLFATRYYFPYLEDGFNYENPGNSNTYLIMSDYEQVPAILAFEDSLRQDAQVDGSFNVEEYRSWMNDENCLRIVFGQMEWNEVATSDSVKLVYEIAVRISGSPITTMDAELDYGGSVPLSYYYNVETGYEELNEVIRSGLKIWSENPDVVQWNEEDGTITALQTGVGRIMIEYEDGGEEFLETVTITVSDQTTNGEGSTTGDNTGNKDNPDSSGNQEGTGGSGNPDNPDTPDTPDGNRNTLDNVLDPAVSENPGKSSDSSSSETLEDQNKPDDRSDLATGVGSGSGGGSGGSDYGMGGTSQGGGSGSGGLTTGTGSGSGMLSAEGSGNTDQESAGEDALAENNVYLSLGNVNAGDVIGSGDSGGGTSGGAGGKAIELEEWPIRYTVILSLIAAALFLAGGTYRSLRFRRETAER